MATAGAIKAGRAYVEAFLEDGPLQRSLAATQAKLRAWGAGLTSLGTKFAGLGIAMSAPVIAATKAYVDAASALVDMSDRVGVSVEALSGLKFAAEQSGTSIEALETGLRGMSRFLDAAGQGGKEANATLARLGLSVKDLLAMQPEDRFKALADELSKVEDPGERAALAMKVFGKSGTALLPMLADGRAGIEQLVARARELGIVMDDESARAAEAFGDKLDQLKVSLFGIAIQIGQAFLPMLDRMVDGLLTVAPQIASWIKNNQGLVVFLGAVAAAAGGAGVALIGMGTALNLAAAAAGGIKTVIGFFTTLIPAIWTATASFATLGLTAETAWALATGGISLLVTAIAAVGAALAALAYHMGVFDPAIAAAQELAARLQERLAPTLERIGQTFARLGSAIEPLLPLIEVQLVLAVNTLATALELAVHQAGLLLTILEQTAALGGVFSAFGLSGGGGGAGGSPSAPPSAVPPVGALPVPNGADNDLGGLAGGVGGESGSAGGMFAGALEQYARETAEACKETARNTRRMLERGGLVYS